MSYNIVMNIFFLDFNTNICAEMHCDKHVVKMIVEYAQLLSTAHRVLDGEETFKLSRKGSKLKHWKLPDEESCYKATHVNHPCAIWVRENDSNYTWLYNLFICLQKEYTLRYNRTHATSELNKFLEKLPNNMKKGSSTPPPKCVSDEAMDEDVVVSYRNFYNIDKRRFAKWKLGNIPYWFNNG